MNLSCDVIKALRGRTLATAESCTGGMIGAALTAVPGSSKVYMGGVISYTNDVKENVLGVGGHLLLQEGAVSAVVAEAMAVGAQKLLKSDFAVSVTGLAGPTGDEFGNPVGTVYIGIAAPEGVCSHHYVFSGAREAVRAQAVQAALRLVLETVKEESK